MLEHRLRVPRTARWLSLGPWEPPGPGPVWFVLHGYGQLAHRFLRRFRGVDDGRRLLVAPEALNRFYVEDTVRRHGPDSLVGGTWMTRHDRQAEIRDYVRYLDLLAGRVLEGREGARVTVLGFSQGLHTAARWAVHGSVRPARLVLWGDVLPPDLDLEAAGRRLAGVDVVMVRGEADPTTRPERDRAQAGREETLGRAGVRIRTLRHPGGHELDADLLRTLAADDG